MQYFIIFLISTAILLPSEAYAKRQRSIRSDIILFENDLIGNEGAFEPSPYSEMELKADVKVDVNHDSNVTQLPDGEVEVVDKKGTQHIQTINVEVFKKVPKKEKPFKTKVIAGTSKYIEKENRVRNAQNFSVTFEKPVKQTKHSKYKKLGFIAQEVDEVLPESVYHPENENENLGMDYIQIVPVVVKAIQEQQSEMEMMKEQLKLQQQMIEELRTELIKLKGQR